GTAPRSWLTTSADTSTAPVNRDRPRKTWSKKSVAPAARRLPTSKASPISRPPSGSSSAQSQLRQAQHRGEQCRNPARPHDLQHERRGLGCGRKRPPEGHLQSCPPCVCVLARAA